MWKVGGPEDTSVASSLQSACMLQTDKGSLDVRMLLHLQGRKGREVIGPRVLGKRARRE